MPIYHHFRLYLPEFSGKWMKIHENGAYFRVFHSFSTHRNYAIFWNLVVFRQLSFQLLFKGISWLFDSKSGKAVARLLACEHRKAELRLPASKPASFCLQKLAKQARRASWRSQARGWTEIYDYFLTISINLIRMSGIFILQIEFNIEWNNFKRIPANSGIAVRNTVCEANLLRW